jgi:hypothetical protein
MRPKVRDFVRAFLPLVPLAMCPGCGESGSQDPQVAQVAPAPSTPVSPVNPVSAPANNRAPTIDGAANNVAQVGSEYVFQPDWSDADDDTLTFTAANLPPWAELDRATGRITGRPRQGDVGSYEGISITVADASHHTTTRDFSIMVVGASSGVANLRWPTPVSKVDGSVLDDLAGFRILYGHDPEDLDHSVFIADPNAQSYEFATLDAGTWYFEIIAVNAGGEEGPATMPAMKII